MRQQPSRILIWWWTRRIKRMKRCRTTEELVKRCGAAHHITEVDEMSIWHYPLRIVGDTLYSIHVAVIDGRPDQVYLHMEPTDG